MSRGSRCFSALALVALISFSTLLSHAHNGTASPQRPLVVEGLGRGTVALDGSWRFRTGDDAGWAAESFDDSGWEQIDVSRPWGAQGHAGYSGYAWYRRSISIDGATAAEDDLALLIDRFDGVYEVYWNGVLVGGLGKMPPHPVWEIFAPPHIFAPAQTWGLGAMRDGVLAIRAWKPPLETIDTAISGGFNVPPILGTAAGIAAAKDRLDYMWLRGQQFTFALDGLYALVMLLSLLTWIQNRHDRLFLWLTLYCVAPVIALPFGDLNLTVSANLFIVAILFSGCLFNLSLWFLLGRLLELDGEARLVRVTRLLARIDAIAYGLDIVAFAYRMIMGRTGPLFTAVDWVTTVVYSVLAVYPVVIVGSALVLRKRLDTVRWLVAACAALAELIPALSATLRQGNSYTRWTIGEKLDATLFSIGGNQFTPVTIARTLLLLALALAAYRYARQASRRQNKLEMDLKSARELQQFLIPEDIQEIPGFTLTTAYKPAQEVGGDFFQIIPLNGNSEEGAMIIVLGDVSGKGLKAAMAVSLIVGMIRVLVRSSASPGELLVQLNQNLYGRLQGGFATCIAMRLERDGRCIFAGAGHPAPFLNGRELDIPGAFPLGLFPSVEYEESGCVLLPEDRIALFTDGLLEARNPAGELYGFDRLHILFTANVDAAHASDAAIAFGQDDDITVLTITRESSGTSTST